MAKQGASLGIKKLEEHLTCSVCLDCYDNPRTLPCLHSFCLKCIQRMPVDINEGEHQISCPTCRKIATLPHNDAADLPSAFVINSLLEIQELLKKANVDDSQQVRCGNCEAVNSTRYCKECATVYCDECLVLHNKLKVNISHHITDVKDIVSNVYNMKQTVTINCTNHNKPLEIFCETDKFLICHDCIVRHHRDHDYDIVTDAFPRHQQEIKCFLQLLKQKIEDTNDALTNLLNREIAVANQADSVIEEIHLYTQQIIKLVQKYENILLSQVNAFVKHKLKLLEEQVKEVETALAQLKSCEEYVEQSLEIGSPQQILLEKERLMQGMRVACEQINPEVHQPVEEANIAFVRSKAVIDTCEDIGKVACSFLNDSKPKKVITEVDKPLSIGINSEGVMVVGGKGNNCITVIDRNGRVVRSFGLDGKDNGKYGICLEVSFTLDGHIIVSDVQEHKIHKLTLQGEYIASVGGRGNGCLQFNQPNEIAVHPETGQMYITDGGNHCIQVINDDFTYSHSIGSKGRALGQLLFPCGVALDSAGNVYICSNTSVDVFTSDGNFIRRFGSKGSGNGELGQAWSIGVDKNDLVYVADGGNHCIHIFTIDGLFIRAIKCKGILQYICGIEVDEIGNLYAFDREKIVVF